MSRISLLDVPIDALTQQETLERLQYFLSQEKQHHVLTPNSEMLVRSTRDPAFRQVLQKGDLNLPDSKGIQWMAGYTGQFVPERVTGVDTVTALCTSLDPSHSVFFLGAAPGVAELAAAALKIKNPHLQIAGMVAGSPRAADAPSIVQRINDARPHILLVAFGAPAQDMWIHRYLPELPSVRIAMGVGGTFDFLAGTKKRAPVFLQRLGLEWAWRLGLEPRRLPRILTAVLVFPWLVIRSRGAAQ